MLGNANPDKFRSMCTSGGSGEGGEVAGLGELDESLYINTERWERPCYFIQRRGREKLRKKILFISVENENEKRGRGRGESPYNVADCINWR